MSDYHNPRDAPEIPGHRFLTVVEFNTLQQKFKDVDEPGKLEYFRRLNKITTPYINVYYGVDKIGCRCTGLNKEDTYFVQASFSMKDYIQRTFSN